MSQDPLSLDKNLRDKAVYRGISTRYDCKNCEASGRIITTSNRATCPGCGRLMRYTEGEGE